MCSYVAVRRCFVSAELHQLQSEDIEQEENGSAAPGLAAQNQQTIRVINWNRTNRSRSGLNLFPMWELICSPSLHASYTDSDCWLLWYIHMRSKHWLCEDVAKQPKNNLKGIKGRLREQNSLALQSQRTDGIVFITTEEDLNPLSYLPLSNQKQQRQLTACSGQLTACSGSWQHAAARCQVTACSGQLTACSGQHVSLDQDPLCWITALS